MSASSPLPSGSLQFLQNNRMPLPVAPGSPLDGVDALYIATSNGTCVFTFPKAASIRSSTLLSSLLTMDESGVVDSDGIAATCMDVLSNVEDAGPEVLSLIVSWLQCSTSDVVTPFPRHDVSRHPGTTACIGASVAAAVLKDPWVNSVVAALCPPMLSVISIPTLEAQHAINTCNFDPSGQCTVSVVTGIRGLALLQTTALVASFLQMQELSTRLVGYMSHWITEATRDESAFGVMHRLHPGVTPTSHNELVTSMVDRSLATPPSGWDDTPLEEVFSWLKSQPMPLEETSEWLSESCRDMVV